MRKIRNGRRLRSCWTSSERKRGSGGSGRSNLSGPRRKKNARGANSSSLSRKWNAILNDSTTTSNSSTTQSNAN